MMLLDKMKSNSFMLDIAGLHQGSLDELYLTVMMEVIELKVL